MGRGNRVQVPACCHREHHEAHRRAEEKLMVNREGSGPLRDPRSSCTLPTRHSTSNERLLCAWTAHSGRSKDGQGSQGPVGDPLAKGDPAPVPRGLLLFKETLLQTSLENREPASNFSHEESEFSQIRVAQSRVTRVDFQVLPPCTLSVSAEGLGTTARVRFPPQAPS